ncbi:hypothetical protein [Methylobacterium sp. 37f]|uniref:hypothetical protein n=1 Tax=Methylobacterium sp. 37f TaxID=2817058 RepID=UPI001FFC734C|nr:hypothetical protein [Methylobacterium sp. 37f]MCK2057193.1 hypothetical protein [Methylobacterium sp. 37f]
MNIVRLALENQHRDDVLQRLVAGAAQGDADAFLGAAVQLTWAGGWAAALPGLLALETMPSVIQDAFQAAWCSSASDAFGLKRTLTLDLLGQDHLLADGLALLLPAPSDSMPTLLYRAQSLQDYRAGRVGCWWTPERELATSLWLVTSAASEHVGDHVLLATQASAGAVICGTPDDLDIVLDPRLLQSVRVVGVRRNDPEADKIAA